MGTGIDLTICQLSEKVASSVGYEGNILWDKTKPDGTPKKQLDVSRLKSLGWSPKIDLNYGIHQSYEAFVSSLKALSARL